MRYAQYLMHQMLLLSFYEQDLQTLRKENQKALQQLFSYMFLFPTMAGNLTDRSIYSIHQWTDWHQPLP